MSQQGRDSGLGDEDRLDERMRLAMQQIPVPGGLQQRLLASLRESATASPQWIPAAITETVHPNSSQRDADRAVLPAANEEQSKSRRTWLTGSLIAASVALIAVGIVWFRPTSSLEQLSSVCLAELMQLEAESGLDGWESGIELPAETARLELNGYRLLGARQFESDKFGRGQAWKLQRRDNEAFILVFEGVRVSDLPANFTVLQASGRWSLAALQDSDRIVVLASRQDVRSFFRPIA